MFQNEFKEYVYYNKYNIIIKKNRCNIKKIIFVIHLHMKYTLIEILSILIPK